MDFRTILLLLVSFISTGLSLFIIKGKKDKISKSFSLFILSIALWSFGIACFYIFDNSVGLFIVVKFYYIVAASIPLFFFNFSLFFPSETRLDNTKKLLIYIPLCVLTFLIIYNDNFLIERVYFISTTEKGVKLYFIGYLIYTVYFLFFLSLAYFNLIKSYFIATDLQIRSQLKFIIIGTIISFICAMYFNLILPWSTYHYVWVGPLFAFVVVMTIFYAIVKHQLFNIKVVSTEILVFSLWTFLIVRSLFPSTFEDQMISVLLLIVTVVVGTILIRSVLKEVQAREKIESLALELEKTNASLAHANSRLKQIDQMKTEFISLATHQIRAPLTAIKGYISLILEGDYGPVSDEVKKAISIVYESTNNLVTIVGDFLDVSRIEQGKMKYDFSEFDLEKLTREVVEEYKPNVDRKSLTFNYTAEKDKNYLVHADMGKIKQIIGNIIDNAIKYTPKGHIDVSVTGTKGKALIKVSDSGVGIPKSTLPILFQKFTRAENANEANILGTGLGLYVARQMMDAHKGRIWAESEGQNKGAQFYVELDTIPVASKIVDTHLKSF
jgi:signal transduction histidine kinase